MISAHKDVSFLWISLDRIFTFGVRGFIHILFLSVILFYLEYVFCKYKVQNDFMPIFFLFFFSIFDTYFFRVFIVISACLSYFNLSWFGGIFVFDSYTIVLFFFISIFIFCLVFWSEFHKVILAFRQILLVFCSLFFFSGSLISIYIFFLLFIFPILIMVLGYGAQIEKVRASYYLLFYASFCSFPFLFVYFYYDTFLLLAYFDSFLSWELGFILTLCFIIKFPVYFLHLWLPKAHVEASTSARILLAGLLLKLGTVGFFRIIKVYFVFHINFWYILSFLGIVLGSFACAFQSDSKALAAYSSISHIGFVLLCLILLSNESFISSLILMLAHGYTSTLIFYLIGEFYHVSSSRLVYYFNSFLSVGIYIVVVFSLVILSNAGVPPSLRFLSEFLSIGVALLRLQMVFLLLLIYFFFAFYYSVYFITNFFIGKSFMYLNLMNSSYRGPIMIMMFNFFYRAMLL